MDKYSENKLIDIIEWIIVGILLTLTIIYGIWIIFFY